MNNTAKSDLFWQVQNAYKEIQTFLSKNTSALEAAQDFEKHHSDLRATAEILSDYNDQALHAINELANKFNALIDQGDILAPRIDLIDVGNNATVEQTKFALEQISEAAEKVEQATCAMRFQAKQALNDALGATNVPETPQHIHKHAGLTSHLVAIGEIGTGLLVTTNGIGDLRQAHKRGEGRWTNVLHGGLKVALGTGIATDGAMRATTGEGWVERIAQAATTAITHTK